MAVLVLLQTVIVELYSFHLVKGQYSSGGSACAAISLRP